LLRKTIIESGRRRRGAGQSQEPPN
jgi:hypothetical protein